MKTTAIATVDPKRTAQHILDALAGGLEAAAKVYRDYIDGGGDPMALREHVPVSAQMWRTLDDVASGRVDVRAYLLPGRAATAVRMLPKQAQTQIIEDGVELLAADGSAIRVAAHSLTPEQTLQAFSGDGVRTLAQQAAWLKQAHPTVEPPPALPTYEIKKGVLKVYAPVQFTEKELLRILGQMG